MSSILKALKKIEQLEQAEESPGNTGAESVPSASVPLHISRPSAIRKTLPYALAAVLALGGGIAAYSWWAANRIPAQTSGQSAEVRAPIPSAPQDQTPSVAPSLPPRPPASGKEHSSVVPPARSPKVQAPPPSARLRPRDDASAVSANARAPVPKREAPPQDRPPAASRPVAAPPQSAEDALNRLDESKLKVMAIGWSNDPQRRLAVVNGHIVKEGESVEGYNITQIRKDDVIVNDGAQSWRVELNLKTRP